MPELPEVETSVRLLKQKVLGKTFVCIWSEKKDPSLQSLVGRTITDVERIGKGIFFHLDNNTFLFTHLKMTGHFLLGEWELKECPLTKTKDWWSKEEIMQDKRNGYLRFVFLLDDNRQLSLSDLRKFADIRILGKKEKENYAQNIGPDALKIKEEEFRRLFKKRKPVKSLLLEQRIISGIGNIYVSEILFKAGVRPTKRADSISRKKIEEIYYYMQEVLRKAISLKGDSTSDFRLIDGKKAGYQNHHLVYNRKNKECFVCKSPIKRCMVAGRGSYYCPACQH